MYSKLLLLFNKMMTMKLLSSFLIFIITYTSAVLIHYIGKIMGEQNVDMLASNNSISESAWWVLLHMLDPGRLENDNVLITRALGLLLVIFGILFIAIIFSDLILVKGKKFLENITDGELPKDLNQHVMIIGNERNIKSFLHFDIRKYLSEKDTHDNFTNKNLILLVNDKNNLEKLRDYIEEIEDENETIRKNLKTTYTYCTPIEDLDTHKSLRLNTASHLILLDDIMNDTGILVHIIEDMIELRFKELEDIKENANQKKNLHKTDLNINKVNVFISIENPTVFQIVDYFISKQSSLLAHLKINVVYFNRYELSSRMILNQNLLFNLQPLKLNDRKEDTHQYALLIDGYTAFSYEFLIQYLTTGTYHYSSTKIMFFETDFQKYKELDAKLNKLFKCLNSDYTDDYNAKLYAEQMMNIEILNKPLNLHSIIDQNIFNFSFLIANQNTDIVVEKMIEYERHLIDFKSNNIPLNCVPKVILEISDESAFRACKSIFKDMHFDVIKMPDVLESFETIQWIDEVAKKIHQNFLKIAQENGTRLKNTDGSYKRQTHNDWEALPPVNRGWNKSNWDHTMIKLAVIASYYGYQIPKINKAGKVQISEGLRQKIEAMINLYTIAKQDLNDRLAKIDQLQPDQQIAQEEKNKQYAIFEHLKKTSSSDELEIIDLIDAIAHIEHNRWSIERLSQGWVYGPRNDLLRHHPNLIAYHQLSDYIKYYDIDASINNLKRIIE